VGMVSVRKEKGSKNDFIDPKKTIELAIKIESSALVAIYVLLFVGSNELNCNLSHTSP
jgi:hypothetical protein